MSFRKGDYVEVCSKEKGFQGSYYSAKILSRWGSNGYRVKYETLLNRKGSRHLVEVVPSSEVRPLPPQDSDVNTSFSPLDLVDAYDNDGWWVGVITVVERKNFVVYFEKYRTEVDYPTSRLRMHKDWINGEWVTPQARTRA